MWFIAYRARKQTGLGLYGFFVLRRTQIENEPGLFSTSGFVRVEGSSKPFRRKVSRGRGEVRPQFFLLPLFEKYTSEMGDPQNEYYSKSRESGERGLRGPRRDFSDCTS